MIPSLSTLLKTIAGKTILGVVVVTMGVGAAAAAGADVPMLSPSDAPDDELVEDDIDDDDIDDDGTEDDGTDDDGTDDDGTGDDVDADVDDAVESETEVAEWKAVKTEGRDGWHDQRDANQAEWLDAKADFDDLCGDDDDEPVEPVEGDDPGEADDDEAEMTPECQAMKDALKILKDEGKSEWKQARDDAKAAWMELKNEAKAEAKAERDEAKAARSEARAQRSDDKPGKKDK